MREDLPAIDMEVDSIPFEFNIELSNKLYTMSVNYNEYGDFFTLDIGDDNEVFYYGVPIVYGVPVFDLFTSDERMPKEQLIAYDLGDVYDTITTDNFNEEVFLYVVEGAANE